MSSPDQTPVHYGWRAAEHALLWLPALLLAVCVERTAQAMPYFDEWAYAVNWLKASQDGALPWHDIFQQHSIHWQPWPKLIVITVCQWFGGDMRVMCWMGVALAAASAWMLWRLCIAPLPMSVSRLVASAALGLAMFSPGQAQTFVWGACFLVIIPVFSLSAILYLLRRSDRLPLRMILCVILSVFAAGSYGSGLIVWCAITVHLFFSGSWLPEGQKRVPWITGWVMHGLILTGFVMSGFSAESGVLAREEGVPAASVEGGISLPWFMAAVGGLHLGAGLSLPVVLCGMLGLLAGAGCAALFVIVCRTRSAKIRTVLSPWVTLAAFAGAGALFIAWGRYTPAGGQLSESRYNSSCHFLSLSLLACGLLHARQSSTARILAAGAAGAWFCLTYLTAIWGWQTMQMWRKIRLQDAACVRYLHFASDEALNQTFPGNAANLRITAPALQAHGRLAGTSILPADTDPVSLSRPKAPLSRGRAGIQITEVKDGRLRMEGFAFLPKKGRPADAIVISTFPENGPGRILAAERVNTPMEFDAIRALRFDDLAALARWRARIDLSGLPSGTRLRVEAVDAETDRLHLLPGGLLRWNGTEISAESPAAGPAS